MSIVMRGITLTVPSLVNPIDLLHIYMSMVTRGLTFTVPSLINPIDLLHIYMYAFGSVGIKQFTDD